MKYVQPYGDPDPNASYVDRNTASATSGSRVPAAAVEHVQREIVAVIAGAGLVPNSADLTQLKQAIDSRIEAVTGSGPEESYLTLDIARGRLPIFPEVLTTAGTIPVVSPSAGQVRVPAGYDFLHRGIYLVTTAQVDFVTAANKTYHLRWTPGDGFALKDLADVAYNPGGNPATEADASFDTGLDDMLVSRVVTNGANVPTIVNLANKARLDIAQMIAGTDIQLASANGANVLVQHTYNWARRPVAAALNFIRVAFNSTVSGADADTNIFAPGPNRASAASMTAATPAVPVTRYAVSAVAMRDMATAITLQFVASA